MPYTAEGIQQFLANVQPFVGACELDDDMAVEIALEELVYEVMESNTDRKEGETFDVRIIDKENEFTVVISS